MSKQWKCKDCCCFGTDACHYPSMLEEYVACEHLVVNHDKAYQQGRIDAIDEAESKVKEYASIWMSYSDGMTKEQIAQKALNSAKSAMIQILKQIKEQKNGL